jgi:hypothetical protein
LRGSRAALLIAVVIPALTAAWYAWTNVSSVNSWLFMELGVSDSTAELVERSAGVCLVLACFSLFWRPNFLACAWIGVWLACLAIATERLGGKMFSEMTPLAHAVRYVAPIALWLNARGREALAMGLLRGALALTFATHGYEALQAHPGFIDLLIPTARRWFGLALRESEARQILLVIGWMDIGLAVLLCLNRWRFVAGYMGLWGMVTLSSRMAAWGLEQWPESTIRLANGAAPLTLLLFWSATKSDTRSASS